MMMNKLLQFIFIFLILFAPLSAKNVANVLPSVGIESVKIGDLACDAKPMQVQPQITKNLQNGKVIVKFANGYLMQYDTLTQRISFVAISSKLSPYTGVKYVTPEGISIGDSRSKVEKVMGKPTKLVPITSQDLYPTSKVLALYIAKGISFHYDANNSVVWIFVFQPSVFGQ